MLSPQLEKDWSRVDLEEISSVYGPVKSWRAGWSLGIDLLCLNSICSFNCVYCQLGSIQVRINERHEFVSTDKVMRDFAKSDWQRADVITFSGNGEPTLAKNLGGVSERIKDLTSKPQLVLTNGILLGEPEVQRGFDAVDQVYVKIDAASEETFQRVNRPVPGVTLQGVVQSTLAFRRFFSGFLGIQSMFLPSSRSELDAFAQLLTRIQPDEVQLNTPTRPYARGWVLETRGSHGDVSYPSQQLKRLTQIQAEEIETFLKRETGLLIRSVYGGQKDERNT